MYLLLFFFAPVVFLLLFYYWNKKVVLLMLPAGAFMLTKVFTFGYLWAQYGWILGTFFLFGFMACLTYKELHNPLLISIMMLGIAFSHFPDLVFAAIFGIIYLILYFYQEKNKEVQKKLIKTLLIAAGIFLIIVAFYFYLFYEGNVNTWVKGRSFKIEAVSPEQYSPIATPIFSHLPTYFWALVGLGIVYLGYLIYTKKEVPWFLPALLTLNVVVFLNYFPFFPDAAYRAFQHRYYWPLYLSFFVGLILTFLGQIKQFQKWFKPVLIAIIVIVLSVLIIKNYAFEVHGPGILSSEQYQTMQWIEQNLPKNDTLLYFYGDGIHQSDLILKKYHYVIEPNEFQKMANNQSTRIVRGMRSDAGGAILSAFQGNKIVKLEKLDREQDIDICDFQYYVFDRYSAYSDAILINQKYFDKFISKGMLPVYQNTQVVILKNNNPGGDCVS